MTTGEDTNPSDWISQSKAAEIRDVSRQAIHDLVNKGRFRIREVAGRRLVCREDVVNYEPKKGGRPPKKGEEEGENASSNQSSSSS